MIQREDYNLGWLLKYENVAWFDENLGTLAILDRRIYPAKKEFVICHKYEEAVTAIHDMVTQSGGPFSVASMGMALAAFQFKNLSKNEYCIAMKKAAYNLSHARPTTSMAMQSCTEESLSIFTELIENGADSKTIIEALKQNAIEQNNRRYEKNTKAGAVFADIVPDGASILTQCFGETTVGGFLRQFNKTKKTINIFCAETRPFLQGARLTASLASSMGFKTTVITDNMPAFLMSQKMIDFCVSATDVVTQDGYIINKIGTLQIAICANYFKIPYYAIGFHDSRFKTISDVKIEYRNPIEVLQAMGVNTAITPEEQKKEALNAPQVLGLYPAFDITPPELCTGIIIGE